MRPATVVVPGRLATRTGGYIYDQRMVEGLRARGWAVDVRELDGSFPSPTESALADAARVLADVPRDTPTIIDGLALSFMPRLIEHEASRLRIIALIHQPRADDEERRALAASAAVVVTGRVSAEALARDALPAGRVVVIEPGSDRGALARGSGLSELQLLCVATVNGGKGHELLLRALATLRDRRWRLTCLGSLTRDLATAARVRGLVSDLKLDDRVSFTGEIDGAEVERWYDRSDAAVLATLQETYGMAVAEAIAHGLPVVSTRTGAIPQLVGGDGGIVVEPGDEPAFTQAMSRVLDDPALRARLAEGARRQRDTLPSWDDAVGRMEAVIESVTRG